MEIRVGSTPVSTSKPKPQPSTFEALYAVIEALPENLVGEIIDGVLYTFNRPASPHGVTQGHVYFHLRDQFGGAASQPDGWVFLNEPELHIRGNVLVPDIAGWRRTRMPEVPDVPYFTLVPDWVCEVLSPSTVTHDRKRKLPHYAAMGIPHVWLVDPLSKNIEVFALTELPELGPCYALAATHTDDDRAAIAPFDAAELDLSELWRR
jgi:Uma2 family endonuclease